MQFPLYNTQPSAVPSPLKHFQLLLCTLQDTILRETQIMHEMRHPNVMPLYCSFVHGEQLWMVMPHVAGGSLFSVIQANYPQAS